jgi:hypothetical protein
LPIGTWARCPCHIKIGSRPTNPVEPMQAISDVGAGIHENCAWWILGVGLRHQMPVPKLDYRGPKDDLPSISARWHRAMVGIGIGVAVTFAVGFVVDMNTGTDGYGHELECWCFPMATTMARYLPELYWGAGHTINRIAINFLQYPVYGLIIGYRRAISRRAFTVTMLSIILCHVAAFIVSYCY